MKDKIKELKAYFYNDKEFVIQLTLILCATSISVFSFLYLYTKHYIMLYDDAASHINIAKRVVDGLSPGFAQFGAVWLPLPHALMVPFVWNNFLWHSGIAGSIVSMFSYIIAVLFTYKASKLFTKSTLAGLVSAIIVGVNINFLYIQAIPLDESLMLAVSMMCLYYLLKWTETDYIPDLLLTALFACLATLTRYEGWFLVLFSASYIFFISWKRHNYHNAESKTIIFCSLAFLGIALWILLNWSIMGNPLYFLDGPYSARSQQADIAKAGGLPTKYNILLSSIVYWWNTIDIVGIPLAILGITFFCAAFFLAEYRKRIPYLVTVFSLPALIIFTLIMGITVIYVPQLHTRTIHNQLFNVRYGLMALPFIAFCSSLLVKNRVWLAFVICLLVIGQQVYFIKTNNIITLNDGKYGISGMSFTKDDFSLFKNLRHTCNNHLILMTQVGKDPQLFMTGIDMKYFITEAAYGYWQSSLQDPTKYAYCIVMGPHNNPQDIIRKDLIKNKIFLNNYQLTYKNQEYLIYKRL